MRDCHSAASDYLAGMRTALALAAFLLAAPVAEAQTVTGLKSGMSYADARAAVVGQGWQANRNNPMQQDELQQDLQSYFIKNGFLEIETCQPTGLGTCTAAFHDDKGRALYLFTSEPDENAAALSSWCIGKRDPNCGTSKPRR